MALTICGKIEEVIFLSKCVLMMYCLMECLSNAFQNAGYSALFLCFISMLGGSDEWRILLWTGLAWGHLSPVICKKKKAQWRDCLLTSLLYSKEKNARSRYQLTIWIMLLQLERERALIEWRYLFMPLSFLKACKTNYYGYWINVAVAHNWLRKDWEDKVLSPVRFHLWKSIPQHASLDIISWYKPQPLFEPTPGKHLSPRSYLCAVKKRFAFFKVLARK